MVTVFLPCNIVHIVLSVLNVILTVTFSSPEEREEDEDEDEEDEDEDEE